MQVHPDDAPRPDPATRRPDNRRQLGGSRMAARHFRIKKGTGLCPFFYFVLRGPDHPITNSLNIQDSYGIPPTHCITNNFDNLEFRLTVQRRFRRSLSSSLPSFVVLVARVAVSPSSSSSLSSSSSSSSSALPLFSSSLSSKKKMPQDSRIARRDGNSQG